MMEMLDRRPALAPRHGPRALRPCRRAASARERGAALTEFVLLSAVLIPLLFGIAMLGQHIDLRQRAVMAGRFTAWESTIDGRAATSEEVRARFFAGAPGDRSEPGTADEGTDQQSTYRLRQRVAALDDAGESDSTIETTATPRDQGMGTQTRVTINLDGVVTHLESSTRTDMARTFGRVIDTAGDTLGGVSGGEWDITSNGLNIGWVGVPVEANAWMSESALVERSVIMNDGWGAAGLEQVNRRSRSFVPAGALDVLADALSYASVVPILAELEGLEGALGHVDASGLPLPEIRRLQPYAERTR